MSEETPAEGKPEGTEGATQGTAEGTPEGTQGTAAGTPDPAEAAAEIERLKAQLAEAAPILQAHKDAEEASKTAEEKLRDELAAAQRERDEAKRAVMLREVADETGLSADVVTLLQGATREELLAAAKKVADGSKVRKGAPGRPNPTVGGGTDAKPTDDDEIDPAKLAAAIAKRVRF